MANRPPLPPALIAVPFREPHLACNFIYRIRFIPYEPVITIHILTPEFLAHQSRLAEHALFPSISRGSDLMSNSSDWVEKVPGPALAN